MINSTEHKVLKKFLEQCVDEINEVVSHWKDLMSLSNVKTYKTLEEYFENDTNPSIVIRELFEDLLNYSDKFNNHKAEVEAIKSIGLENFKMYNELVTSFGMTFDELLNMVDDTIDRDVLYLYVTNRFWSGEVEEEIEEIDRLLVSKDGVYKYKEDVIEEIYDKATDFFVEDSENLQIRLLLALTDFNRRRLKLSNNDTADKLKKELKDVEASEKARNMSAQSLRNTTTLVDHTSGILQ